MYTYINKYKYINIYVTIKVMLIRNVCCQGMFIQCAKLQFIKTFPPTLSSRKAPFLDESMANYYKCMNASIHYPF